MGFFFKKTNKVAALPPQGPSNYESFGEPAESTESSDSGLKSGDGKGQDGSNCLALFWVKLSAFFSSIKLPMPKRRTRSRRISFSGVRRIRVKQAPPNVITTMSVMTIDLPAPARTSRSIADVPSFAIARTTTPVVAVDVPAPSPPQPASPILDVPPAKVSPPPTPRKIFPKAVALVFPNENEFLPPGPCPFFKPRHDRTEDGFGDVMEVSALNISCFNREDGDTENTARPLAPEVPRLDLSSLTEDGDNADNGTNWYKEPVLPRSLTPKAPSRNLYCLDEEDQADNREQPLPRSSTPMVPRLDLSCFSMGDSKMDNAVEYAEPSLSRLPPIKENGVEMPKNLADSDPEPTFDINNDTLEMYYSSKKTHVSRFIERERHNDALCEIYPHHYLTQREESILSPTSQIFGTLQYSITEENVELITPTYAKDFMTNELQLPEELIYSSECPLITIEDNSERFYFQKKTHITKFFESLKISDETW